MFGCKSASHVFLSKDGSWLITFCQISWENCKTIKKKNISQSKIAKHLCLLSTNL